MRLLRWTFWGTRKKMPRKAAELSAYQVKRIKKPGQHAVGGVAGLRLRVKPSGARSWVLRTTVGTRRRDFGLGGCPTVTLEQARKRARGYLELIADGVDPVVEKSEAKRTLQMAEARSTTFTEAAKQCHRARAAEFRSARHSENWFRSLELYALPVLGNLPVDQIEVAHVINVLKPIWTTKTETARRVRQRVESVFTWAKVAGYREGENPARWAGNLKVLLSDPSKIHKVKHYPTIPWQEMGGFMTNLRLREGMAARALEFAILTASRSGEVRSATWAELENDVWTIPAERMKGGRQHRVPLSPAALELLAALPRTSKYLFPNSKGTPLSDMSLSSVTRRMQVDAVPHGFRSAFKDWSRSCTSYADEVSELALAHVNSDATRAAYARDELLPKRKKLMAAWAEHCGRNDPVPQVTPIKSHV